MAMCQDKKKFGSEALALQVADHFMGRNPRERRYAYQCPACHCWHLSKSPTKVVRR